MGRSAVVVPSSVLPCVLMLDHVLALVIEIVSVLVLGPVLTHEFEIVSVLVLVFLVVDVNFHSQLPSLLLLTATMVKYRQQYHLNYSVRVTVVAV